MDEILDKPHQDEVFCRREKQSIKRNLKNNYLLLEKIFTSNQLKAIICPN